MSATRFAIGLLSLCVLSGSQISCGPHQPELLASPAASLVDEEIEIAVSGLNPNQEFTVRATTLDQRQRPWIAVARFTADDNGGANLARAVPLSNSSYEGADSMGLFWSAESVFEGAQFARRPNLDYPTTLELVIDDETVGRQSVIRRFDAEGILRTDVDEGRVIGTYYRPEGPGPFAGVAVFAGSDGGLTSAEWRAALLASRGFAALAVAVFGHDGRPENLVEVPLEDGIEAVSWLAERPETGRIGAIGFSKGAEMALSIAARYPGVEATVAISPSAFVWPGISDGPPETRSLWTWQGAPVPTIPWAVGPRAGEMFAAGPPFLLRLLYEESLAGAPLELRAAAEIPVAQLTGALMLISGDDDGSWPASEMSRTLVARMTEADRADDVVHLRYPGAGHLLFWDLLPATASAGNKGQIFGGTPAATAAARADSWRQIQTFLRASLQRGDDNG